jgi:hypothetical protein
MFNSHTLVFQIERPLADVYEFLLEPTNFGKWVFAGDARMRHLGGREWSAETSVGPRIIRFAERNSYGVLDYFSKVAVDVPWHAIPMRVLANGEGTELTYTSFQRPGMSEAEWKSVIEWVNADLLALKSLLEAHQE